MTEPDYQLLQRPEMQLVMLCCRLAWSDEHQQQGHALAQQVTDWPLLLKLARQHFVAPLVARHLTQLPDVPASTADTLRGLANHTLKRSLLMLAELARLLRHDSVGTSARSLKGLGLGAWLYDNIWLRSCRDIDLLLPAERIAELVPVLQAEGYTLNNGVPLYLSGEPLRHYCHRTPVVCLSSPQGIQIELHSSIDWHRGAFPVAVEKLYPQPHREVVQGITLPMLNYHWLVPYLFFHHAKHFWSQLNWITDASLIMQRSDIDWQTVHRTAQDYGLVAALSSGMLLAHRWLGTAIPEPLASDPQFLACGETLAEVANRRLNSKLKIGTIWEQPINYLRWMFHVQPCWRYRLRMLRCMASPTAADYLQYHVGDRLAFLYYLTRPFRLLYTALRTWLARKVQGTL